MQNPRMKIIIISVLLSQSLTLSEQHNIMEMKVIMDGKMTPKEITAKLEISPDDGSIGDLYIYIESRITNTALVLNKENREELISHYNKYEEWKIIAIENKVEKHTKEIGKSLVLGVLLNLVIPGIR